MSAMKPLYALMGLIIDNLSKEETIILEAELFACLCGELKNHYSNSYRDYFRLLHFTVEQEKFMLEVNFIRSIIRDILYSEEYTLTGIACYTDTHEDIVREIFSGINTNPSANFLRRIIELHRSIRSDLYRTIMRKVAIQYLAAA